MQPNASEIANAARPERSQCMIVSAMAGDERCSDRTRRVLARAAELRVTGQKWEAVAAALAVPVPTVKSLRQRHPNLWRRLYTAEFAEVYGEAEAKALQTARGLLDSPDARLRLRAAATILAEAFKRRPPRDDELAQSEAYEAGVRAGMAEALRQLGPAVLARLADQVEQLDREERASATADEN